jgi:outer membrane protein assembly factor BamB
VSSNLFLLSGLWLTFADVALGFDSDATVEQTGIVKEWTSQIDVGARSKIVNMQLQVNEDKSTRYYLVEYGDSVERVSQFDLDAFGKPRGIEGAESYAKSRQEVVKLEMAAQRRSDIEVRVRPITLPKSTIYGATSDGNVFAIDADTGRHLWSTRVGDRTRVTSGAGASKNYVAAVNGTIVYCLAAESGKVLWSKPCHDVPTAPPSVSDDHIFVPLISGRLDVFSVDPKQILPRAYLSFGTSISKPLVTSDTVSWATEHGFYAVAPLQARSIKYRLNSGSPMVGGGIADSGNLYVANSEGSLIALNENRGSMMWQYSTGDRLTSTPFAKSGAVYVVSSSSRLYKVDAKSGLPPAGWEEPISGISQFVGMSQNRIYLLDNLRQLVAIDPETGARIGTGTGLQFVYVLPNLQTDRLYLGGGRSILSCYREVANTYPIFHTETAEMMAAKDMPKKEMADDAQPSAATDDPFAADDPFDQSSDESDPFAADSPVEDTLSDPGADEDDPFGGSSDSSDSGDDDDPFGGG